MTALKYITESKICTTAELLNFKREFPKDFDTLLQWAKEEMEHNGVTVDAPNVK